MARLFEAIYYDIFEHLLAANSKNRGFLSHIFIYFGRVKIYS